MDFSLEGRRVWVAGHAGMVGSAIVRRLAGEACTILTATRREVDLRSADAVKAWMLSERPDVIFMAAAKVGGILANDTRPAEFLYDNLMIAANVTEAARISDVRKMLFLGSSCIYPKLAPQPMSEAALLQGALEPTNEWYAIAKIAGIKLSQSYRRQYGCDFICAMPTNLYGPNDNYDLQTSHVLPALLRKIHEAKTTGSPAVEIWGSGAPRREFLYVDDLADACVHLMTTYSDEAIVNVGLGRDLTILELAQTIAHVVGWRGTLVFDSTKPDGTPRKLLDVGRLAATGWTARTGLREGLNQTYAAYLQSIATH